MESKQANAKGYVYHATYGDGGGHLIDWSGITAVIVCFACGEQQGPYFSITEARSAAVAHRLELHSEPDKLGRPQVKMPPDAVEESVDRVCRECERKTVPVFRKGLCAACGARRRKTYAEETQPHPGSFAAFNRGCRCEPCKVHGLKQKAHLRALAHKAAKAAEKSTP